MHLLQSGVDITVVALWLGHESPATTHLYIEADLKMKEVALKALQPPTPKPIRYRPPDRLLRFLKEVVKLCAVRECQEAAGPRYQLYIIRDCA